jgi:hypothetical protein
MCSVERESDSWINWSLPRWHDDWLRKSGKKKLLLMTFFFFFFLKMIIKFRSMPEWIKLNIFLIESIHFLFQTALKSMDERKTSILCSVYPLEITSLICFYTFPLITRYQRPSLWGETCYRRVPEETQKWMGDQKRETEWRQHVTGVKFKKKTTSTVLTFFFKGIN